MFRWPWHRCCGNLDLRGAVRCPEHCVFGFFILTTEVAALWGMSCCIALRGRARAGAPPTSTLSQCPRVLPLLGLCGCLTRLCLGRFLALDRDAHDGRATGQAPGTTVTETLAFAPVLCRRDPHSHEDLTFLGVPKSVLTKRAAQIRIQGNQALTTPCGSCGAVPITSFSQGSRALIGHPFSNS